MLNQISVCYEIKFNLNCYGYTNSTYSVKDFAIIKSVSIKSVGFLVESVKSVSMAKS